MEKCSVLITSKVHTHSFLGYKTYLKQKAIDLYSDHCTILQCYVCQKLKGNAAYLKKYYIIHENDSLSEYNKIPLGHNRTNGAVYSKIYFKVQICSALSIFESHPTLGPLNVLSIPGWEWSGSSHYLQNALMVMRLTQPLTAKS